MIALLGAVVWLGGAGGAALAAGTFFVDGADPGCSNTGPGTAGAPYCTITAAANARGGAGTTILVKPAVYREQVTVPASGGAGSSFVLQAFGPGAVVDGAEDFSSPAQWTLFSGNVWLAESVTWSPKQVFADGARLTPSSASPASLPPRTFRFISGDGLYVHAGGGNPATHQTLVGRRSYGFRLSGRSWVTIDGFAVTRTEDRGFYLSSSSNNTAVTNNTVTFANHYGIQVEGSSGVLVAANMVSDHNDHGIAVTGGSTGVTIQDNESFRNARPAVRAANGLYLNASTGNLIQRNSFHHNQDSGWNLTSSANNNISLQNLSWSNGDHGFDQLNSQGTLHVGDVAWGNLRDGFSVQGTSTKTKIFNSIAVNNGLTTGRYNLMVESGAASGFVSNYNILWNATGQDPISYSSIEYATIADFTAARGHDANSTQADPQFVDPAAGDFRLQAGSPAIDSADSSVPNWPATDAEGSARVDDPATPNTGAGPVPYADRGALEFLPSAVPQAVLTASPASGEAPLAVTLDASGSSDPNGTIVSYEFDPGDGTAPFSQAGPKATHTYAAGTFTARVTVTDNDGATDSATATVTATPPNQAPVAVLTATPASGEAPLLVSFDASGSSDPDGGTIVSYLFNFGDGTAPVQQQAPTATHTYAGAGTFTATVTVTDDEGGTASTSKVITVSGNQPPNGTIDSPASNVTIVAGQSVSFNGTGTDPDGHPLTFLWNFGGGAPNQEVEDPGPVVFNTPGTYPVTFTVTDSLASADPTPDSRVITVTAATTSNLVGNPSFETDTSGWKTYGSATIQRITGGVDGAFALEVRGSLTSTSQFGVDDNPSWVASTPAAGTRYRFTAWVRSEANTGEARLRVREYLGGSQVGVTTRSAPVVLSPAWQMLTVDYVSQAAGSRLDVHVLDYIPVTTGEVFQTDNIAIRIIP